MSFEEKFSQEITNFQRYGTYTYEYDEVGNLIFNSSSNNFSQVYLGLPLSNFVYDDTKVLNFYDPTFTEFVPPASASNSSQDITQVQSDLDAATTQNEVLTKQLQDLIAINESTPSLADQEAAKQVILELRKSLGEGRVDSDFSTDFPYAPVTKELHIANTGSMQQ
jgi:hypothetical protein